MWTGRGDETAWYGISGRLGDHLDHQETIAVAVGKTALQNQQNAAGEFDASGSYTLAQSAMRDQSRAVIPGYDCQHKAAYLQ